MKFPCCVVLLALLAAANHCSAGWGFPSYFIDGAYFVDFEDEMLAKYPKWKPADGNPPVSPRQARAAADEAFAKAFDPNKYPGWSVLSPSLELCKLDDSDWLWLVSYHATWKGYEFPDDPVELTIYVPMNGEAVVPGYSGADTSRELELKEEAEDVLTEAMPTKVVAQSWDYGNQHAVAMLTSELLASTPDWKPETPHPPLALDAALQAATAVQGRWLPTTTERLSVLKSIYLEEKADRKWVWVFYYEQQTKFGGSTGIAPYLAIPVLMDGKAVEPVKVEPTN